MQEPSLLTLSDIHERAQHIREHRKAKCLGKEPSLAVLNTHNLTIRLEGGYEIDVEEITTPQDLVDWLYHLKRKTWFLPEMLIEVLDCFELACELTDQTPNADNWHWNIERLKQKR